VKFSVLALAVTLTIFASPVYSEDWPQWRGLHRDGKSPETNLLETWPPDGPKLLWQADGVGDGHASVSIAHGLIYTTGILGDSGDGVLSAVDLSGHLVWQTHYGKEWIGSYPGARSCPTVDGDRGYIVSGMGLMVCFDAKTGALLWTENIDEEFAGLEPRVGYAESPLVHGNTVICTPGGENASLVALDKLKGTTVWTTKGLSDQSAYCSPILVERGDLTLVVTITARSLVGIDIDSGDVVWRVPFDTDAEDPNHSVSPVYEDGCIYITSGHRKGGCMVELAADGKSIVERWTDETLNTLHGGLVIVAGNIYGSNTSNKWTCLDLRTGELMYETRGVGMGSLIYADGMLYCYGEKGTLGLVKAAPAEYQLIGSFKLPDGEGTHWAHPAISDGRLYIRHGSTIRAYDVSAD
jgi:outer membrane protein assembly factor BamB